jgi:hypothetical protein
LHFFERLAFFPRLRGTADRKRKTHKPPTTLNANMKINLTPLAVMVLSLALENGGTYPARARSPWLPGSSPFGGFSPEKA